MAAPSYGGPSPKDLISQRWLHDAPYIWVPIYECRSSLPHLYSAEA